MYIYIYIVFANGVGDCGSILCRVILKTQKFHFMPPCLTLSLISFKSRVSGAIQGKV